MPTSFPMSIPHAPTGFVNQAALDAAFSTPINDLYALLLPILGVYADSGVTSITPSGINVATTLGVVFNKTFATAPRVILQVNTGVSGTGTVFTWPSAVTTTGFTLNINRSNTTATSVSWLAILTN